MNEEKKMNKKQIAKVILANMHDFDEIVYALQSDENSANVLDECGYDFDGLVYWAQDNG